MTTVIVCFGHDRRSDWALSLSTLRTVEFVIPHPQRKKTGPTSTKQPVLTVEISVID